jgi:diaminopimelate epimerase
MHLTKHHGLGNDFLVLLDLANETEVDAGLARALCDRHRGVGADGLIHVGAGTDGAAVTFRLRNADGSEAEMSGNGISCLAQAVVDAGVAAAGTIAVATVAGVRTVQVGEETAPGLRRVTVDMGPAVPEGENRVSMGNPHEIVLVDDLEQLAKLELAGPSDRNVEYVVAGPETGAITMRVVERGVGETQACGTGACAAAYAASRLGMVGAEVIVHQPGGDAEVVVGDTLLLTVPVQLIARIEIPWR